MDKVLTLDILEEKLRKVELMERRLERLEGFLLTFRQTQLIMLSEVESFLGIKRSVQPRHKPK